MGVVVGKEARAGVTHASSMALSAMLPHHDGQQLCCCSRWRDNDPLNHCCDQSLPLLSSSLAPARAGTSSAAAQLTRRGRQAESLGRTLPRHVRRDPHQVAHHRLVPLVCLGQPRQAIPHLGDDQKVDGRLGRNVAEGQRLVVLVDDIGWDLLGDDLVEQGGRVRVG